MSESSEFLLRNDDKTAIKVVGELYFPNSLSGGLILQVLPRPFEDKLVSGRATLIIVLLSDSLGGMRSTKK